MTPSRQFRPDVPVALEGRIAPGHAAGGPAPHPARAALHAPAHVGAGAAAPATFPRDIADTIAAGLPVQEQRTTRYGDGSSQTETRLIQPDNVNGTTLTTSVVNLPRGGGVERVTDFSYVSADGSVTHVVTTDLPDGSYQTENRTEQAMGTTTQAQGTLKLPGGGGVEAITASSVTRGPVTTTDKTITLPDGAVEHEHVVTVARGELHETTTDTLTRADGSHQVTRSSTAIVRLQPPSPVSAGTPRPGAVVTAPKLG